MFTTEQVRINTMQVEIKSMMVGKKQLTLSLMRQIIEEPLIDEKELLFRGVPWGHVNYFWGDDKHKSYPRYINVVWQKGDVLRRSVVAMELPCQKYLENGCHRDIAALSKQIEYYSQLNTHNSFEQRLEGYTRELMGRQADLLSLEYRRNTYIPKYNELVQPLKSLDHFYITV